jgi:hypothetical protein
MCPPRRTTAAPLMKSSSLISQLINCINQPCPILAGMPTGIAARHAQVRLAILPVPQWFCSIRFHPVCSTLEVRRVDLEKMRMKTAPSRHIILIRHGQYDESSKDDGEIPAASATGLWALKQSDGSATGLWALKQSDGARRAHSHGARPRPSCRYRPSTRGPRSRRRVHKARTRQVGES